MVVVNYHQLVTRSSKRRLLKNLKDLSQNKKIQNYNLKIQVINKTKKPQSEKELPLNKKMIEEVSFQKHQLVDRMD